jgi:prolyl 4-hydroxylase
MMSQLLLLLWSQLFLLLFAAVVSSAHRTLPPPLIVVVVDDDDGTATTRTSTTTSGADTHEWCAVWRDKGECRRRVDYMRTHCPVSCATASNNEKGSYEDTLETVANDDDDDTDVLATRIALLETTIAFGERQRADGEQAQETLELIEQTVLYLQSNLVSTSTSAAPPPPLFDDIMMRHNHCRNRHELCAFWAVLGECDINSAYMHTHCGPSCRSCHVTMIDVDLTDEKEEEEGKVEEERCVQLNTNKAEPALRHPGDLNRLFERIIRQAPGNRTLSESSEKQPPRLAEQRMPMYTVHVHSRPEERTSSSPTDHQSILYASPLSPWIVTFDNFVTDEECDALIALGYEYGYQRSDHVGGGGGGTAALSDPPPPRKQQHQREPKRTSENAWCSDHSGCRRRDLPQLLHQRMASVLDIPPHHSEDLQILKYETGQYYRPHHDYIPQQGTVPSLTCWIVADYILTIPTLYLLCEWHSGDALRSAHLDLLLVL